MNVYFASQNGYLFRKEGLINDQSLSLQSVGYISINWKDSYMIILDRTSHEHASDLDPSVLVDLFKTVRQTISSEDPLTIYLPQMNKLIFEECAFQNTLQTLDNTNIIYL